MHRTDRREFLSTAAVATLCAGSMSKVLASAKVEAQRGRFRKFLGYGELVPDPRGILDLPSGFEYRAFSSVGDALSSGQPVPSSHDGMAAFAGLFGTYLVRNHELSPDDIAEDGLTPVSPVAGRVYDPDAPGGTTTLLLRAGRLVRDEISLAGTLNNCAGGPTPWRTWLTCEEDTETLGRPHGYVFEVDPLRGGDVRPIVAMGRFEHEAVAFDLRGLAYLTEDADGPHGCFYRFIPNRRLGGRGSLLAGGSLSAMAVAGVTSDLSSVLTPGLVLPVRWVEVPNPDPGDDDTTVREQVIARGATPIPKAEGVWTGLDGSVWFVSSRGDGLGAEDEDDVSAGEHAGQIWRYDPRRETIELVVIFPKGSPFDGPDNITVSSHGFALACTDGEDDQWLVSLSQDGRAMPFAFNALNDSEFAGACFDRYGETLFVNIQDPGMTFAVSGPWARGFAR